VNLEEVTIRFFELFVLVNLFGQLKNLVCKTLQPVAVSSLVFP
jgi:hypothetical protein